MIASADPVTPRWPEAMSVTTAARYAELSPRMVRKLLTHRADPLPSFTLGRARRIRRSDLDAYFAKKLTSAVPPHQVAPELRNRAGRSLV